MEIIEKYLREGKMSFFETNGIISLWFFPYRDIQNPILALTDKGLHCLLELFDAQYQQKCSEELREISNRFLPKAVGEKLHLLEDAVRKQAIVYVHLIGELFLVNIHIPPPTPNHYPGTYIQSGSGDSLIAALSNAVGKKASLHPKDFIK